MNFIESRKNKMQFFSVNYLLLFEWNRQKVSLYQKISTNKERCEKARKSKKKIEFASFACSQTYLYHSVSFCVQIFWCLFRYYFQPVSVCTLRAMEDRHCSFWLHFEDCLHVFVILYFFFSVISHALHRISFLKFKFPNKSALSTLFVIVFFSPYILLLHDPDTFLRRQ